MINYSSKIFLMFFFVVGIFFAYADDKTSVDCTLIFKEKGQCPVEVCKLGLEINLQGQSLQVCKSRPCPEISRDHCSLDRCQIIIGCEGKEICYYKENQAPPQCGPLAYTGQDVDCCEGLVRRCGVEFFDGSCDMLGKNSMYAVPICLPCGDGICGQFENHCNCPEDCRGKGTYAGFDFERYKIEKSYKKLPDPVENQDSSNR